MLVLAEFVAYAVEFRISDFQEASDAGETPPDLARDFGLTLVTEIVFNLGPCVLQD